MEYIGKKERNKTYEKRDAIYVLAFNENNEIAVINVKQFGYILPCEHKKGANDKIFKEIEIELGHKLIDVRLNRKVGVYYSMKLNNEMVYCDVKADIYKAKIRGECNDETIDGHEIVWKKLEALYEKMALDFQGQILETIIRQGVL